MIPYNRQQLFNFVVSFKMITRKVNPKNQLKGTLNRKIDLIIDIKGRRQAKIIIKLYESSHDRRFDLIKRQPGLKQHWTTLPQRHYRQKVLFIMPRKNSSAAVWQMKTVLENSMSRESKQTGRDDIVFFQSEFQFQKNLSINFIF